MKALQVIGFLFLASFLPGFVTSALGQGLPLERAPIVTDRPSFTTGPRLLDPGILQMELGYTYRDDAGETGLNVSSGPETLVRYGFNEKLELRFGWDGYDFVEDAKDEAGNTFIGWKYKLGDFIPDTSLALITTISLPTGSGKNDVDPQTLLGWERSLDDKTTLAGNIGYGSPTDELTGDRFTQGIISIMCSRTLNEEMTGFAEYYTNFPAMDGQDAAHVLHTGVAYLLNVDMQLDFRAGVGLNDQADDWFIGVGFSYKF